MKQSTIQEAINRIQNMEQYFDTLQQAVKADPGIIREDVLLKAQLRVLTQYYEGGQWLKDYDLDEQGLLPQSLKRGVLAQDAVYDFLEQMKDLGKL